MKIKKACLNNFWFLFAAYLLFWEPAYIKTQLYWADKVFDAGNLLFLAVILIFYAMERKISRFDIALACMGVILMASTIFHQGPIWKCLKYLWPIAAVCLLTEMAAKENPDLMIRAQYYMCYLQVAINTLTVALLPDGLYKANDNERQFWLGNENVFIVTILAGLCVGYLDVLRRKKKITLDYLVFAALSLWSVVLVWSATALIGLTIFAAALVCSYLISWKWLYKLKTYIAVWCAGFFGITIFRLQYLFKPIIVNLLHKKLNLTKRTKLWDYILEAIKESPVWGYGVETAESFSEKLGGDPHWVHAHNYILELLIKGGVLVLAAFLALLFFTAQKLDKCIEHREAKVISISLLAYFIVFIGDCFEMRTLFYMILALGFSCEYLIPERRGEKTV
ncbi:MAG: O-antigen ligase family protein [Eubacteriales bacterium]|nr:O-antigen ligase family protein [Eubacteriales bacterium]